MNIKHVVALSVLAFVANVAWADGATYVYPQKSASAVSRAEVRRDARAERGTVQYFGDIVVDARPAVGVPAQRADIRAQARREARSHEVSGRLLP
ncbi:MAG: hypothetical protein ABIX46_01985 [Burkholderiaceae bacterium]